MTTCTHCNKPIEGVVAYWLGKKVHPKCFNTLKKQSNKDKRTTWMDELWKKLNKSNVK